MASSSRRGQTLIEFLIGLIVIVLFLSLSTKAVQILEIRLDRSQFSTQEQTTWKEM